MIFFIFSDEADFDKNGFMNILVGIALIDFMMSSLTVFSREVRNAQTIGTFESLLITKTSPALLIFSSYALTLFRSCIRIFIYFIICKYFFDIPLDLSKTPLFLVLAIFCSLPFIGLGMISASFIIVFKVGNIVNLLISLLSIFFSGIFFPTNTFFYYVENVSNFPLKINLMYARILSPSFTRPVNESLYKSLHGSYIDLLGILLVLWDECFEKNAA